MTSQRNMYKVGDFVFFENTSSNPYQIRRIEDIIRTENGVNIKVQCFFRRRDIPTSLIQLADKHVRELEEDLYEKQWPDLSETEKHQLHHREVYMARPSGVDTVPATLIRGKCDVNLLSETDKFTEDYLKSEDQYFYTLVYDQNQRTVVADRGDIRMGENYQAEIPDKMSDEDCENMDDGRELSKLETLVWDCEQLEKPDAAISKLDLDRFVVMARSVGLFARALDATAATVQPILQVSAGMAARDCTMQWAMDAMHDAGYDLGEATRNLVTNKGPILVRDQLEAWSPSEAQLFEDGIDRYGKEFQLIRSELLPWKTNSAIIEFYYMWKASDRYLAYKRTKTNDSEKKLKQVYIPNYTKKSSCQLEPDQTQGVTRPCEGCCTTTSETWFSWGPANMSCRLCQDCWSYWKRYGGLKIPQNQRIEIMQQQQKKIPGQSDEKKSALRVSTQMTSVTQQQKRAELEAEKEKRKQDKDADGPSESKDETPTKDGQDKMDDEQEASKNQVDGKTDETTNKVDDEEVTKKDESEKDGENDNEKDLEEKTDTEKVVEKSDDKKAEEPETKNDEEKEKEKDETAMEED